jgi:hypothetical protein
MLPYLIAGAIGFGIGKLFEEGGETFAGGGQINSNFAKKEWNSYLRDSKIDALSSVGYSKKVARDLSSEAWESLEKNVQNAFKNYLISEEVRFMKSMMKSLYIYGGIEKGSDGYDRYLSKYENILGKKMFDKIYEEELERLQEYEVEKNVYTDSEGLSYSSLKRKYAGGGEVQDELHYLVSDFDSNEYEAFCYEFDIDIDDANQMTDFISQLSDEDAKNIINQIENGYFSDSEDEYAGGGEAGKKGKLNATYIPKRNIKTLTTTYGNTIKGKDLLDGAYTTQKDIRQDPKMVRTIFEEEEFAEFKNGGGVYDNLPILAVRNYDADYFVNESGEIVDNGSIKRYAIEIQSVPSGDVIDYTSASSEKEASEMIEKINNTQKLYADGGLAKKRRRRANTQTGRTDRSVDKTRVGKPVGYRFTNSLASKLRKDKYAVPTEKQITKYLGKGIYKENRKNRSDRDRTAKL